jgi:signal transduction histidine kinase
VARRFQPIAEQKGLWLRVIGGGDDDVEALTDRQKLDRVVSNLVDNAIKFTQRGGVTLELAQDGAGTRVLVGDTGIGVPERDAPFLFDEFYQVDNHERDRRKGFGMGLAICRSLARQLGGDVRLARTSPGGSCFEVAVAGCGPRGGGRRGGEARDHAHPEGQRVCRV